MSRQFAKKDIRRSRNSEKSGYYNHDDNRQSSRSRSRSPVNYHNKRQSSRSRSHSPVNYYHNKRQFSRSRSRSPLRYEKNYGQAGYDKTLYEQYQYPRAWRPPQERVASNLDVMRPMSKKSPPFNYGNRRSSNSRIDFGHSYRQGLLDDRSVTKEAENCLSDMFPTRESVAACDIILCDDIKRGGKPFGRDYNPSYVKYCEKY
jgi:hypothetical protein